MRVGRNESESGEPMQSGAVKAGSQSSEPQAGERTQARSAGREQMLLQVKDGGESRKKCRMFGRKMAAGCEKNGGGLRTSRLDKRRGAGPGATARRSRFSRSAIERCGMKTVAASKGEGKQEMKAARGRA